MGMAPNQFFVEALRDVMDVECAGFFRHLRVKQDLHQQIAEFLFEVSAQVFRRERILGRHLIALGRAPGPEFKPALDAAFESQLDGAFSDEPGGIAWLKNYLRAHPPVLTSQNAPLS